MKKNLLWMFAAILLCGLTITMFTACGDDDPVIPAPEPQEEEKEGEEGEKEGEKEDVIVKAGVYDISVAYIVHRSLTNFFDIELTTTDNNGKETTYSFKTPQDQSDGFQGTEAKDYQAVSYGVLRAVDDLFTLDYCNDVIVRRIIFKDVPVDKSVKFITVFHKKQDLQVTPQRYAFIRPSYVFTQTPKDNQKATVLHDSSARGSIIGESSFEKWLNSMDGKRETNGTFLMTAGSIKLGYVEE
ncbi:MAG: hypothetical protein IJ754_03340 [Bacteroidaceae bacterium]|nr:hypothetical protein [Bacteroidaceae bacterium]